MKLVSIRKDDEVEFKGVNIEIVRDGSSIVRMILSNDSGDYLEVSYSNYEICVRRKAPPEEKKVFRLSGKFLGLADIKEDFEYKNEAEDRLREYEGKAASVEDVGLVITEETALIP